MSNTLEDFIDEHDLTVADVVDALGIDPSDFDEVPDEPHAFYDGEPTVEDLADDFDAVALLHEEKADLEARVDSLEADLHEHEKEAFADRAADLADLTERWGDEQRLVDRFEDDEDDEFQSVDDIDTKIELVEDIRGDADGETTTVADDADDDPADEPDFDRTKHGRFDLRSQTK